MRVMAGFVSVLLATATAGAQTGTLSGTVTADSARTHLLVGAEITIPALGAITRSNFAGDYQFTGLKAGRYVVQVRAPGYKAAGDTVTVAGSGDSYHDFVLLTRPGLLTDVPTLDTVRAKAESASTIISPSLRGFEERSRSGFGWFITEKDLRKNDNERLTEMIIAKIPGVGLAPGPEGQAWLMSGRKRTAGPVLMGTSSATPCLATVYVDGVMVYNYTMEKTRGDWVLRPDFNTLPVKDYAGVEYYAGAATMPPWISPTNNDCGVLLLWTRER